MKSVSFVQLYKELYRVYTKEYIFYNFTFKCYYSDKSIEIYIHTYLIHISFWKLMLYSYQLLQKNQHTKWKKNHPTLDFFSLSGGGFMQGTSTDFSDLISLASGFVSSVRLWKKIKIIQLTGKYNTCIHTYIWVC